MPQLAPRPVHLPQCLGRPGLRSPAPSLRRAGQDPRNLGLERQGRGRGPSRRRDPRAIPRRRPLLPPADLLAAAAAAATAAVRGRWRNRRGRADHRAADTFHWCIRNGACCGAPMYRCMHPSRDSGLLGPRGPVLVDLQRSQQDLRLLPHLRHPPDVGHFHLLMEKGLIQPCRRLHRLVAEEAAESHIY